MFILICQSSPLGKKASLLTQPVKQLLCVWLAHWSQVAEAWVSTCLLSSLQKLEERAWGPFTHTLSSEYSESRNL
jgi:hypothetical protein